MLGMDDVSNHTFRHTAASRWIANGLTLQEVSVLLGHTNINQTSQYALLSHNDITRKATEALNEVHRQRVDFETSTPTIEVCA